MKFSSLLLLCGAAPFFSAAAGTPTWAIHDPARPQPPVVQPRSKGVSTPPSTAQILFDGRTLDGWEQSDGQPARWRLVSGAMEVEPGTGGIQTKAAFGSCRLHIEWRAPASRSGTGQEGGNSGVFLMGLYEVQVLDSYKNPTYADGMAGAIYGQNPPSANPTRRSGDWNAYDITFHRPKFDAAGNLLSPARVSVVFNGVTVQDNFALTGPTAHHAQPPYKAHPDKLPLALQEHGDRIQFRNIWIEPLVD